MHRTLVLKSGDGPRVRVLAMGMRWRNTVLAVLGVGPLVLYGCGRDQKADSAGRHQWAMAAQQEEAYRFGLDLSRKKIPMPAPFSRYPEFLQPNATELVSCTFVPWHRFRSYVYDPEAQRESGDFLVKMTWFVNGRPTDGQICSVSTDGMRRVARDRLNWGIDGSGTIWRHMRWWDLRKVRNALRKLPQSDATPALNRLLLVSYWDGQRWATQCYDRMEPPPAVVTICNLAGYRLGTGWELEQAAAPGCATAPR